MKKISILGCGWLGLPLAKSLLEKGFSVKGSTTATEKISVLENCGILPYLVSLSAVEGLVGEKGIPSFLENSEVLVIDIPPKLRSASSENFVKKIQNLIPFIEKSSVEKVIFISSTSLYSDDNSIITEATIPNPDTESGKQLLETENLLKSNPKFKTTVIRFGGLIGENRHPIHFLAGKQNLENPDAPINLIHQTDCIGIIEAVIKQDCWNENFNAVDPYHPTRAAYYTQKAIEFNLPLPEFEQGKISIGKMILSDKIETHLGYQFQNITL